MMSYLKTLLLAVIIQMFWVLPVLAEYRVYQYAVKSKNTMRNDPDTYIVTSTLDPVSYISYHGGSESINVDLLRTWICRGYTGFSAKHCPSPYDSVKEEAN